jgi:transcriptional regulator with XRE-family HTH domain
MTEQSELTAAVVSRVKELRKTRGLSQFDLMHQARLPPHLGANFESGRRIDMSIDELFALASALGVTPTELLGLDPRGDAVYEVGRAVLAAVGACTRATHGKVSHGPE